MQTESAASSHYHGYPNEWHGPKRKYNNSRRKGMGNHGGGIPKGGSAKPGSKGVGGGSADKGSSGHGFHVGDHVRVHAGVNTGTKGEIKRKIGANHVHIVPKSGRSVIAHVRNVSHVGTASGKLGGGRNIHGSIGIG